MSTPGTTGHDPGDRRSRLSTATVAHDLGLLLALAAADALERMLSSLEPYGLTPRPFTVLAIAADGLQPTQRELADFLRIDPSQIVAIIDDLEIRGLVERKVSPSDRRANVIVVTESGAELVGRCIGIVRDANRTALTLEDETRLHDLLDGVVYTSR